MKLVSSLSSYSRVSRQGVTVSGARLCRSKLSPALPPVPSVSQTVQLTPWSRLKRYA